MTYQKPTLIVARALDVVMGSGKDDDIVDSNVQPDSTPAAYEADE